VPSESCKPQGSNVKRERVPLEVRGLLQTTSPERVQGQNSMNKDAKPSKEWWDWYLAPPIDPRKVYGNPLEFDEIDRYYQALYEQKLKEKNK